MTRISHAKATKILQAILDNDLIPHRVECLRGIFRVGDFLCVTDGHACLALKSDETIVDPITRKGVHAGIAEYLKVKSSVSYCDFAALREFVGPRRPAFPKCDKCDEDGSVPCECKGRRRCMKCDADGMRNCDCGYTSFPVDKVRIGSCVFNRYLLQIYLENVTAKEFKFKDSVPDNRGGGSMLVLGESDWRLFVMPMVSDLKGMPHFKFEDHLSPSLPCDRRAR